jgi:cell division protease FtsH
MSDLGPLAYRKPGNAYDADRPHAVSEATAQRVDEAIRKVVLHGYDRARKIIVSNREPLRVLAEELLVQESLEASEIRTLLANSGARTESGQVITT